MKKLMAAAALALVALLSGVVAYDALSGSAGSPESLPGSPTPAATPSLQPSNNDTYECVVQRSTRLHAKATPDAPVVGTLDATSTPFGCRQAPNGFVHIVAPRNIIVREAHVDSAFAHAEEMQWVTNEGAFTRYTGRS